MCQSELLSTADLFTIIIRTLNRFGVLERTMHLSPETATTVTKACGALHNFLQTEGDRKHSSQNNTDQPRQWVRGLGRQGGHRNSTDARLVREESSDSFSRGGALRCQQDIVTVTSVDTLFRTVTWLLINKGLILSEWPPLAPARFVRPRTGYK